MAEKWATEKALAEFFKQNKFAALRTADSLHYFNLDGYGTSEPLRVFILPSEYLEFAHGLYLANLNPPFQSALKSHDPKIHFKSFADLHASATSYGRSSWPGGAYILDSFTPASLPERLAMVGQGLLEQVCQKAHFEPNAVRFGMPMKSYREWAAKMGYEKSFGEGIYWIAKMLDYKSTDPYSRNPESPNLSFNAWWR